MKASDRNGVVLFIVTIVIALIALSAYGFVVLMQGEYRASQLRGDTIQTEAVTDSAIEYSMSLIGLPRYQRDSLGIDDNQDVFRNVMVDRTGFANRNGQFSIVSFGRTESMETYIRFGFANESAKLPLAALLMWDEQIPGSARQALLQIPRMTAATADAILDWIDEDSQVREFGAEDLFYMSLDPPREPANRIPKYLHELLGVRGVSRGLLYGLDVNRNGRVEEHERPRFPSDHERIANDTTDVDQTTRQLNDGPNLSGDGEDDLHFGWREYITVASRERNVNRFGQPRINLNSKNLKTLHRQLESAFGVELANFIVAIRQYGPHTGPTGAPTSGEIPRPSSKEAEFTISEKLILLTAQVAIGEDEAQEVFASPLHNSSRANLSRDLSLGDFLDSTTLSQHEFVGGRINVLLAPREVLMCLPNITKESVDGMITSRTALRPDEPKPPHPYWLVEQGVLDVKQLQQLESSITHGGDVFAAQILAYYDEESPWDRGELMIDGSGPSPQKVYYTSLNQLGRGFAVGEILVRHDEPSSGLDERGDLSTTPTESFDEF